jgi:phenylpyruvate tautomerase PptA (4-oxalocrotonate tautomerase family)
MPLCQVLTNVPALSQQDERALLADLSRLLAQRFEKPERWVMTCLLPGVSMTFGGTTAPTAFVAVKNVGTMRPAETEGLSREICDRLAKALSVPPERVYIQFTDAVDYLWGWNGGTLA